MIKKNQLAKEASDARVSRFNKGDKIDVMISELDISKRKVSLSIKALEEKLTKEAVKKYGSEDSGASLGEILGPISANNPLRYGIGSSIFFKISTIDLSIIPDPVVFFVKFTSEILFKNQ